MADAATAVAAGIFFWRAGMKALGAAIAIAGTGFASG